MQNNGAKEKLSELFKYGSKLGLERMEILMGMLGNPEKNLKVIHVAGTNGKGSTCRFLSAVSQSAGYKTGLFTSPALVDFKERLEIDGMLISEEDLERISEIVFQKIEEMKVAGYDSPTEFEAITAIAFIYFFEQKVDLAIMEVGLGGRGDSTNIIKQPVVCVITSIDFDHMDRLGYDIKSIAYEKAGIVKENVPMVANLINDDAAEVIREICQSQNAEFVDISVDCVDIIESGLNGTIFELPKTSNRYKISMLGKYQVENAKTAIKVCEIINRRHCTIKLDEHAIKSGLQKAFNKGRFEICSENPMVVIDGAHNVSAARALMISVKKYFPDKKVLVIMGVLKDKDVENIVDNISKVADEFIITEPSSDRKLDAGELESIINNYGVKSSVERNLKNAYKVALEKIKSGKFDMILVCGSLYLIGEIREMIL